MTPTLRTVACATLAVAAAAAIVGAQGQSRPGQMSQSRVWVENRSSNEAIPVVVERMVEPKVHVATVDAAIVVATRAARQGWEYRSITLGFNPAADLDRAGIEGWEAVAVLQTGTVLMKRPR